MEYSIANIVFQNAITTASNGAELSASPNGTVNISFGISNGGTFTANFEAKVFDNDVWFPIVAVNMSTLATSTTASDATAFYQVDLTGVKSFRVRVSAISGTLSAYGRVIY